MFCSALNARLSGAGLTLKPRVPMPLSAGFARLGFGEQGFDSAVALPGDASGQFAQDQKLDPCNKTWPNPLSLDHGIPASASRVHHVDPHAIKKSGWYLTGYAAHRKLFRGGTLHAFRSRGDLPHLAYRPGHAEPPSWG